MYNCYIFLFGLKISYWSSLGQRFNYLENEYKTKISSIKKYLYILKLQSLEEYLKARGAVSIIK